MDDTRNDRDAGLQLLRMAEALDAARVIQLAVEVRVADRLGDGPRTVDALARDTGTQPDALRRLLRALAGFGLCTETEPDRFDLTEMGERLRTNHPRSLRSWVGFQAMLTDVYAAAAHSIRTGEPTYPRVHGAPIFQDLARHDERGRLFHAAMAEHSRLMGGALATGYDLGDARLIVDVGGGDGSLLAVLLDAYPDAHGLVFDLPEVADIARKRLAAEGLSTRCTAVGGDFLAGVPSGGDVYLMKGILHNWADDDARTLLRNCRSAMRPGDRLLMIEAVVPDGDAFHPSRLLDLAMLIVYGGRERTLTEHRRLLAEAGLRFTRVVEAAAPLSVIEAVPADDSGQR
ncbi:methyltransferase [Krasilnikovia sp. MM14-A1259]|uniref:methyltransferase n=1 Tax=Krasilnikovia sp. MM14-A1259 TaxID=3373539 RepID=UPI0037F49E85